MPSTTLRTARTLIINQKKKPKGHEVGMEHTGKARRSQRMGRR